MKFREFGEKNKETLILIHGGGLSWWNYRKEAGILEPDLHIVLPVIDGHAGSDRPFTSIEDNAEEIIQFIDERFGGSVLLIGGLSLGAQILLEMLSMRKDICRYALVESACVIPSNLSDVLAGPALGSSYGLIRNRAFAKLQFRALHMDGSFFEEYYRDTCRISKEDMAAFLKASASYTLKEAIAETEAKVHVIAGEKETGNILRSAEIIGKTVPGCETLILPGLYHGEFSINHPERYAGYIKKITGGIQDA